MKLRALCIAVPREGARKEMKPFSPQKANTSKKVMKLKRDSLYESDYWIVVESNCVQLVQNNGARISIPKKVFDTFVTFYVTPQ